MNRHVAFWLLVIFIISPDAISPASNERAASPPAIQPFDNDWKFNLGDVPGAQIVDFDDAGWRRINLPHDWSIEQPFDQNLASGTAFLPGGVGWYRKSFSTPPLAAGQHLNILFDGVYKNAEVWINGHSLGKRPNGFIGYDYELTPFLFSNNRQNILAVRVDHSDYADSRFYTGSGIYRHVWLQVTNAVHLVRWGTSVTTANVSSRSATIKVQTRIANTGSKDRSITLVSTIFDSKGHPVASLESPDAVKGGVEDRIDQTIRITNPALWSVDSPNLYTVVGTVKSESSILDEDHSPLGIRSIAFDPDRGFFLNGVKTILKGVCVHQDEGSFGAAVPEDAMKRRLLLLKELGCNAIRTSHNPPAPEFLDLCDKLGFLVMDEAFDEWARPKRKWVEGWNTGQPGFDGYSKYFAEWSIKDIQAIIERDKNHPSVILWSIGNEIDYDHDPYYDPTLPNYTPDHPSAAELTGIAKMLSRAVKNIDQTRPVTAALAHIETSNRTGLADALDVVGYNYQEKFYQTDHAAHPGRLMFGSENYHSYDAWKAVEDIPYATGQFLWTGFDYLGEARRWPLRGSGSGVLDECGFKKPAFYFRQSLWTDKPVIYLATIPPTSLREQGRPWERFEESNWTWPVNDGQPISISCYTNCPSVKLLLNGKSLGTQLLSAAPDLVLHWKVPFAPGTLRAEGLKDDSVVCSFELKTTSSAKAIKLKPESTTILADGRSLCFVDVSVVDSQDNPVYSADNPLTFQLHGAGKILALDSGDLSSHEDFRSDTRRLYHGKGLVILQSTSATGPMILRASGKGLTNDETTILSVE